MSNSKNYKKKCFTLNKNLNLWRLIRDVIKFEVALDIKEKAKKMIEKLDLRYIDLDRVIFMRSYDSKSKYTIARCYALPRIWQKALGIKAHYIIEVISERFDKMNEEEKEKTILHEILHIPKRFAGGFRHHKNFVNKRKIEEMYKKFKESSPPIFH
jgi:predicted metallopeptidase